MRFLVQGRRGEGQEEEKEEVQGVSQGQINGCETIYVHCARARDALIARAYANRLREA